MLRTFYVIIFFAIVVSAFLSCNRAIEQASYVHIAPFTFTQTPNTGAVSTDITNGQVFIDGVFVGDYEFPVTFPVLKQGSFRINVLPSVKINGVGNGRKVFKLYQSYSTQVSLIAGKVDSIKPNTSYKNNVVFAWLEDFDNNTIGLKRGANNNLRDSLVNIGVNDNNAWKGSGLGYSAGLFFSLNTRAFIWEANSVSRFMVPKRGSDIYFELDLKSDVNIKIGILAFDGLTYTQTEVVEFFSTDGKWKKLYCNLVAEVGPLRENQEIGIFIGGINSKENADTPMIFIDNLKLAYLQ